jgi:hypothetical protein
VLLSTAENMYCQRRYGTQLSKLGEAQKKKKKKKKTETFLLELEKCNRNVRPAVINTLEAYCIKQK